MGTFWTLTRRELGAYFISPVAYVLMTVFLLISGLVFWDLIRWFAMNQRPLELEEAGWWVGFLSMLISPFVTMRLLAEEKNRGTLEMLMTAPLGEWVVVLSKFFASLAFYGLLLVPTSFFFLHLSQFTSLDLGEVFGVYLAFMLLMASVMSIGLFVSSLCSSQVSAGVVTLVINLLLAMMFFIRGNIPKGSSWLGVNWYDVMNYVDFMEHTRGMIRGVVDSKDLAFYLSVTILFLFWTVRVVESRRWK